MTRKTKKNIEVPAFILAGGQGKRLNPLTDNRSKPYTRFNANGVILDPTLLNCLYTGSADDDVGVSKIYLLAQYLAGDLSKYAIHKYLRHFGYDNFHVLTPPFTDMKKSYEGTADSVKGNLEELKKLLKSDGHIPETVLILSADHVYTASYGDIVKAHIAKEADMTIYAMVRPKEDARHFGILEINEDGRVIGFEEKPQKNPKTIPGRDDKVMASMGIYVYNTGALFKALNTISGHDFGKNIIPAMISGTHGNYEVFMHEFDGRWDDIGTIPAYHNANILQASDHPYFDVRFDPKYLEVYRKVIGTLPSRIGDVLSLKSCEIDGEIVSESILSPKVKIKKGARVKRAVLLDGVNIEPGSIVEDVVIDKFSIIDGEITPESYPRLEIPGSRVEDGIIVIPKHTNKIRLKKDFISLSSSKPAAV